MPDLTDLTDLNALPLSAVNFDRLPDSAHVDVRTVSAIFGRSIASVWRDAARGALPQPRKMGPRCTRWRVGELRQALADRAAA